MTIFFTAFKGAPSARQAPGQWPGSKQESRSHRVGCVTETGTTARTKAGEWGYCPTPGQWPCRAPSGGSPAGRAAARAGCPASAGRRYPPQRCVDGRVCKDRAWPVLRARHPLTAQDHSQGRSLRSRRRGDGRKRPPLSSDLARQDHRHLSEGRRKARHAPTIG